MNTGQASHERLTSREIVRVGANRAFGFVFGFVFAAIGLWPLIMSEPPRIWALILAALFFVTAQFRPSLLRPLNRIWFQFGQLLHRLISPLILGLIYYLMITPIAMIMRLSGRDILGLSFDQDSESYWITRQPQIPYNESMRRQF